MKRFMKGISLFLILMLASLMLFACGSSKSSENGKETSSSSGSEESNVSIGTYQPGIAYHTAASGLASVITDNSNINATIRPFSGPKAWYPLMDKGEIDLGYTDFKVNWAIQGINGNKVKTPNIRTIAIGNNIPMVGYTVREDSGINSLKDLKGKNVAFLTASPESFNPLLEVQLNSVGLTWDDVKKVPVSDIAQGIDALREGRVDATFMGTPTVGLFLEVENAIGIKGLNLADVTPDKFNEFPEDLREKMVEKNPGLEPVVNDSGFLGESTVIYQEPTVLVGSAKLSDEVAYETVKTLFENYEKLHPIFTWLEDWNPEQMFRPDPPAPYHPGAIKYFKEQGIWTDEAEKNHEELMKLVQ